MGPILCCAAIHTRWTPLRETTEKRRLHGSSIAPTDPLLARVERIRHELASGCYPFAAHLNAVIERFLNILSQENAES